MTIEFEIFRTEQIQIDLFDINGKKVINLMNEKYLKGQHRLQKSFSNYIFSKGIYFVVMQNKDGIIGRRKIVFKGAK